MDFDKYLKLIARDCFRDEADGDYIAARAAHRMELMTNFFWSALQAIEKYFKGILLFNKESTLDLSHDIEKALKRINMKLFQMNLSSEVLEFIMELNKFGEDRYSLLPKRYGGNILYLLDKAIWEIRRYCNSLSMRQIKLIESDGNEYPFRQYSINNGKLEKILESDKSKFGRKQLVYNNAFFSLRKKKKIKILKMFKIQNSLINLYPGHLQKLKKFVVIPKKYKYK